MNLLLVLLTTITGTIVVTLTIYHIYWILPTKQKKPSDPDFHQARIIQLSDLLRFILTYGQALRRIFHIEYLYVRLYRFSCICLKSTKAGEKVRARATSITSNFKFPH